MASKARLLKKFLAELRKKHQQVRPVSALMLDVSTQTIGLPPFLPPKTHIPCRMSATRASWLFVSQAGKLDAKQTQHVAQIHAAHPDLEKAYQLSQAFILMLSEHRDKDLDEWLRQAEQSRIAELKSFVQGIRREYAAVRAAFSSRWSNGITEGHVNRLKFLKRQMFGRAHLDLLRVKVLHAV